MQFFTKIKIKKILKYLEITLGKMIHTAIVGAHLFTCHAERIFICQQDKGQIIMPQILIKPVHGRQIKQSLHLFINSRRQFRLASDAVLVVFEDTGKLPQDAVLPQIAV